MYANYLFSLVGKVKKKKVIDALKRKKSSLAKYIIWRLPLYSLRVGVAVKAPSCLLSLKPRVKARECLSQLARDASIT